MKFKYCPKCGSMSFVKQLGNDKCVKCNFVGIMSEGAMDEINAFQKSLKSGKNNFVNTNPKPGNLNYLKEKMNSLKGKSTDDFEIL
ncbi:MAG: hypothetical protein QXZ13_04155 [Candidatus Diapherotrites archaeon]